MFQAAAIKKYCRSKKIQNGRETGEAWGVLYKSGKRPRKAGQDTRVGHTMCHVLKFSHVGRKLAGKLQSSVIC